MYCLSVVLLKEQLILFSAKLEAFEIEEIKNSKNRKLKSRIRKAKNIMEVTAFTAALLISENNE